MTRVLLVAVAAACLLATAGCGAGQEPDLQRPSFSGPSKSSVAGKSPVEALAIANQWKGNSVKSWVTTSAVNFEFANGQKAAVDLPAETMVVAVAPYISRTHPCEVHYMSGCQGELVGVPVEVLATAADGTVLVNETMTTMANGFLELWLPRGISVELRLTAQGKSTLGTIGTFSDSNTCVTTLQLT